MDPELPQNRACPKCGVANLATATRCVDCGAALHPVHSPPDDVLWIDGREAPSKPSARPPLYAPPPSGWRPFFRFMGLAGIGVGVGLLSGTPQGGPIGMLTFVVLGILVLFITVSRDEPAGHVAPLGYATGPLDVLDTLLRAVGYLFTTIAVLLLALVTFLFIVCTGCR